MPDAENARLPRNRLSFFDRIKIVLTLLPIPIYVVLALIKSPFTLHGRSKSWKRIIADPVTYTTTTGLNRRQLRAFFGTTAAMYETFMKRKNLAPVVEEIGDDARLLWIGPKHTDRVVIYFHGGAYLIGALESTPVFWWWMKDKLAKRGKSVGFAMLNYTLIPDRTFPTQLNQAVLAIQHVINSGVSPENIQLTGDSAGGLLIHQVLSHMLHPVEGVPPLNLEKPFAGTFLISPWTRLRDPDNKYLQRTDGKGDFLSAKLLNYWGTTVLEGTPKSVLPYLEANETPKDWFKDLPKCTKRILISAGGLEVLFDEIIKYAKTVEKYHRDTTTIVQETGVHVDPIIDFFVGDYTAEINTQILDWLDESFSA